MCLCSICCVGKVIIPKDPLSQIMYICICTPDTHSSSLPLTLILFSPTEYPQSTVCTEYPQSIQRVSTQYPQSIHIVSTEYPQSIHRVSTEYPQSGNGPFLAYIHHDGKIIPAWCGWGVHALPLSLFLPSRAKLRRTLQLRGQMHSPLFLLYPYMYSVFSLQSNAEATAMHALSSQKGTKIIRKAPVYMS